MPIPKVDVTSIFADSKLVAKVPKNRLEEIRVLILKNGRIDVRSYIFFPQETEPKPTRKGVWLSFKDMPEIIKTLETIAQKPHEDVNLEIPQTERVKLRVYTDVFHGKKIVHLRTFYLKGGEYKPGKGLSFIPPLSEKLAAALKKAQPE